MRLRFLQLPRCGPLSDIAIVFGHEDLITKALDIQRRGSLNFLVGVNGSGKSSLLRALFSIFRSLKRREWPALPVTLAWDRTLGGEAVTTFLHHTNQKDARSFFASFKPVAATTRRHDWEEISATLCKGKQHPLVRDLEIHPGLESITSPLLFARLPKRLITYTSGADNPWVQLDAPVFNPKFEEEEQYQPFEERPQGWSMEREWEEAQSGRVTDILMRYTQKMGDKASTLPGDWLVDDLSQKTIKEFMQEFGPMNEMRKKRWANLQVHNEGLDDSYTHIHPHHLRFAGITLALWQTVKELSDCPKERQREALRNIFLRQGGSDDNKPRDARFILNQIDWFWPTHLSLTYHDVEDRISPRQHQELFCLVALADEVITQPGGRQRAVFSLGPSNRISLTEKLEDAFPFGIPNKAIEFVAKRVDGCRTMAEAILRVFSEDDHIDSTPMDAFSRLKDWGRTGLLDDITLTVKRLHRTESTDDQSDDIIVAYDQLSDGEQMLLGRMGLLFLLRGQNGSLLLLDEPETHFNDVWKREIVEMVDMGLLNSTDANVIVATHTSIALTDAFAAEVTVLDKKGGEITARGVTGGLFGTDPGEVNMNLFRADNSIGSRSAELLNRLLKTDWKNREGELEAILSLLGSSFHRAELRAVLKRLQGTNHDPASS